MHSQVKSSAAALTEAASSRSPIAFGPLRDALSASYCLMFAECVTDRQVEAPVVEGVDHAYGDRLQAAAAEHLLPTWLRGLDEGMVIDRAALARDHDFARSDFYNYVIRPEGRFHCLIATPHVTPTRRYHLIVGRPARYADFTSAELLILRALLPHVARLIASVRDAVSAADQSKGLMAAFDCLEDNIAITRGTGELEFANAGARRLVAVGDGLHLAGTKLRAMHGAATAALLAAIAQVTADDGPDEVALDLPRPSCSPPYQVRVRRIDMAAYGMAGAGERRAMLLILPPDPPPQVDGHALARDYGLTGRELEIAILLSHGGTLRHAAGILGVSYETARSHLRTAFSKMDVHRQSDLVRRVLQDTARRRQAPGRD